MRPKFFNPFEDVRKTRHNLPHWQQPGNTYFLTFRLADSIPAPLLKNWEAQRAAWLALHPTPLSEDDEAEYHRRFSGQLDRWLDAGHGLCALSRPEVRRVVEEALGHFEGARYFSFAWVIMPNHVHMLIALHPDWSLEKVVFTWKRRTAGEINRLMGQRGKFWQHDYFDRLVRDETHFGNALRYIRRNPFKGRLQNEAYTLYESEFVKDIP